MLVVVFFLQVSLLINASQWTDLNLPPTLMEYHIRERKELAEQCRRDTECPVKADVLDSKQCWGYEEGCIMDNSYGRRVELGKCKGNNPNDVRKFFDEADFGYVKSRQIRHSICQSESKEGSSLVCSNDLKHCYGKNIFFDFKSFKVETSARYRSDLIHEGEVGGRCETNFEREFLLGQRTHRGYLQSWTDELEHFESYEDFSVDTAHCDVIMDRPTIVVKLDAAVNLYHHFCDFINIYASQHINGSFQADVDIVWWDTHSSGFVDAFFGSTWSAFSSRPPIELTSLAGRRVCFRDVMLPLLARQRFGLYYNMPLTPGCSGSGLVHSFSHHLLHRLSIPQNGPLDDVIRVTILSRSTRYRKILNVEQLSAAARQLSGVELNVVDYNGATPFLSQLSTTHNSDIFIGMHGAGLTHLLFLPDWAAVMEIYNCDDRDCYSDLARLRGVKYFTWPEEKVDLIEADSEGRHPTLGTPHKKFANYRFDVEQFIKSLKQMMEYVRRHPKFVDERRRLRRQRNNQEL